MFPHLSMPQLRRIPSVLAAACLALGYGIAQGQSIDSVGHSDAPVVANNESSSSQGALVDLDGGAGAGLPAAPAAGSGAGSGQYDADTHHGGGGGMFHHLTFEAGGGFNAPQSDSSRYITWGGQFGVGAGYQLTDHVAMMVDYQYIDDKLPGALIAETGATGGNAHIWSFTLNPMIDLMPKRSNDLYVTGGGGFYRKVTNFTDPQQTQYCDYFYCYPGYTNAVVGHFSSNQGGWTIGGGYQHRLGGAMNDGRMKLFAEVKYLDVLTPASTIAPNGLGTAAVGSDTKLIPVTFGVRW